MSSSSAGGKKQLKKVLGRLDAEEKALLESARNRIIPETVSKQYQETHIMYQDKAKIEALEQRMESDEIDSALVRMSSSRRLSRKKFDTTVRPYLALLLEYFKCPDAWSDPDDVLDPLIETLEDIDADWLILTQVQYHVYVIYIQVSNVLLRKKRVISMHLSIFTTHTLMT
jgi:hypothetical protein